jgi:hypothetical protein
VENISTLENIQEYDNISFSTQSLFDLSNDQIDRHKNESFSWLSFFIDVDVVLLILIVISLIIFLIIPYRKKHNFECLPVYV